MYYLFATQYTGLIQIDNSSASRYRDFNEQRLYTLLSVFIGSDWHSEIWL